jgi:hypothetical protein
MRTLSQRSCRNARLARIPGHKREHDSANPEVSAG